MFEEVINVCKKNFSKANKSFDLILLEKSLNELSEAISHYSIKTGDDLPYGRYLIFKCNEFNIQLDIFSRNYIGSIHNHGTWGIFGLIQGNLIVNDWIEIENKFSQVRTTLVTPKSLQTFVKENDWHSIKTTSKGMQAVSLHIYGPDYNLDIGYALDENLKIKKYTRSAFKENTMLENRIISI